MTLCRMFISADVTFCSASIYSLIGITLDRFYAVYYPVEVELRMFEICYVLSKKFYISIHKVGTRQKAPSLNIVNIDIKIGELYYNPHQIPNATFSVHTRQEDVHHPHPDGAGLVHGSRHLQPHVHRLPGLL